MSDPRRPDDEGEHDAWLHQALRHAPDAAAAPPNTLREAILAEARSAVQARRSASAPPSLADRLGAFWSWLARPPIAAGFASVMAATLVGLMWWDRPMDETLPPPATSSSRVAEPKSTAPLSATAPAVRAAPPTTTAPTAPMAPAPGGPTAAPALTDAEPPPRASPAAAPPAAAAPPPAAAATRRALLAPAKTTPAAADAMEQRKDGSTANSVQAAPPASPFPSNAPGESAAAARERAAGPALAKKAEGEAATAAAESQRAAATPQAFAAAPTAAPTMRDSLTNARPLAAAGAASTMRPMAALLASIAAGAGHWSRPTSNGDAALDAPTQAWLDSVDAATAGRWLPRSADRTTRLQGALAADTGTLALSRDGGADATVRVEDGGVLFEQSNGAAWFAPLPAEAVARLRATLPR